MNKTKVVNIIGASGSGKTTVALKLDGISSEYNIIQSYTTRPPREDGEWGHTFIGDCFVSYDSNDNLQYISEGLVANSKTYWSKYMIAYFNSYNSGHHYFATDEQVLRGYTNIYIVDSKGAEQVHDFYKGTDVEVITVYLQVDEVKRCKRLYKREKGFEFDGSTELSYLEQKNIHDRMESDKLLFQTVKCDYVVDGNQDLDMVVNSIRDVI